jgi:dolichol-phosphate mannosyltransferase
VAHASLQPKPPPGIAVVIPCYRVKDQILSVLKRIGSEVERIYVVDDACPQQSGRHVLAQCNDPRVVVLFHEINEGVGGAVITGYRRAAEDGAQVIVKIDGDGQMAPELVADFVRPILDGRADYTKGNRFYNVEDVRSMPPLRLMGNAALSFMTKLSAGYWHVFDPTNGYTAISATVVQVLPLHKLARRYFFESDMLFRLGTFHACVLDIPMAAVYGGEQSNLKLRRVFFPFLLGNLTNMVKRICYGYFLRDFSIASLELLVGLAFLLFGCIFGLYKWIASATTGVPATTGTVMLAALPVILGIQFLLSFVAFDVAATPQRAIHPLLTASRRGQAGVEMTHADR